MTLQEIKSRYKSSLEFQDSVCKATFAYHVGPELEHGHNWSNGSNEAICCWCKRSRFDVRWSEGDPRCYSRPDIKAIILNEETKTLAWLDKAEKIISKWLDNKIITGQLLAQLHETEGYSPEQVKDLGYSISESILANYKQEREKQSQIGLQGFKPKVIKSELKEYDNTSTTRTNG